MVCNNAPVSEYQKVSYICKSYSAVTASFLLLLLLLFLRHCKEYADLWLPTFQVKALDKLVADLRQWGGSCVDAWRLYHQLISVNHLFIDLSLLYIS
jgi:hypothetical protein